MTRPRLRLIVGTLAVAALLATAGCSSILAPEVPPEKLDERPPQPYDWETDRDVTVTVVEGGGPAQTVYDLSALNTSEVRVYEEGLSTDTPLWVRSVRYRYPNGTVINGSSERIEVTIEGNSRVIRVPGPRGKLAYTAETGMKQVGSPGYVSGTYEVILPPGHRVGDFLFARVVPGGYTTSVDAEDRVHVEWSEPVEDGYYVRYYLARDVLIFRVLVVVLAVVALVGLYYYLRQIRALEEQREEVGLDVDTDDDFGDGGGPPGFG